MSMWTIFFLLCFIGQAFMFFCILHRQDALIKSMREDHAQFKALLRMLDPRNERGAHSETAKDESSIHTPLSVEQALGAYSRSERLDMDPPHSPAQPKNGMPELKF